MTNSNRLRGNCIGIAGGMLLSTDALFIRLMHIDDAWLIVMMRGLLMWSAFSLTYAFVPRWRPMLGNPWPTRQTLWATVFFAVASVTFVNALTHGEVAPVLLIISSTPFISAFFAHVFLSEKADRVMLASSALGMCGVAVVVGGASQSGALIARYFAMATAVSMALAFLCSSRVSGGAAGLPSLGALVASLVVMGSQHVPWQLAPTLLMQHRGLWILIEGALVMPLSLGLLALSARYVSAASTGLFLLLETALAPLWIWIAFDENPGIQVMVGGLITVSAVFVYFIYSDRRFNLRAASSSQT